MHGPDLAAQLVENGVKQISVFVPAADPTTFQKLAQPPPGYDFNTLCSFVVVAAEQGCLVECTTANRPGVDVKAVKDLCLSLGAVNFRERSYHP